MHAHDRTLLARLGFQDPDHKDPVHDLACEYLAAPERVEWMARKFGVVKEYQNRTGGRERGHSSWEGSCKIAPDEWAVWSISYENQSFVADTRLERAVVKGAGPYASHIGFLDVFSTWHIFARENTILNWGKLTPSDEKETGQRSGSVDLGYSEAVDIGKCGQVAVEVKIARCPLGDVLRQINLYRQYLNPCPWVVAVAYDIDEASVSTLRNEQINVVRLGPKFRQWLAARHQSAVATIEEA